MQDESVEYTDNPELGEFVEIEDFLPSPAELAQAPVTVNVRVGLSSDTFEFFKEQAKQHNTSYQRMIRRLLDEYVAQVRSAEGTK